MKMIIFFFEIFIFISKCQSLNIHIKKLFTDYPISFPMKENIIILTSETIDEAINTYPDLALFIYSPWCSYCKDLYHIILKIANSEKSNSMNLIFAKIDGDYHNKVNERFDIRGFPTLLYFSNGILKEDYKGDRNENDIIEWFYKRIVRITHPIESIQDIKKFEETKTHKFIYFGNDYEKIEKYHEFAVEDDLHMFGLCKNLKLIEKYEKAVIESVILYKPFDEPSYVITQNITKESLKNLLNDNLYPLIWKNTIDLLNHSLKTWKPCFLFFRDGNDSTKTPKYDINFKKLAEKYKEKILFGLANTNEEIVQKIINESNITDINKKINRPSAMILDLKKGLTQWKFQDFFPDYTESNLEQFLLNWLNKNVKPPGKSEEIPKFQEEGKVFKIVNKSFQKDVINNKLNVFVMFYFTNCTECKKLEQNYTILAEQFKMHRNIRIANFNVLENDFDLFKIKEYPTLVMFKSGDKENPLIYNGNRSVDDMLKFVLFNLGFPTLKKENNDILKGSTKNEEKSKKEKIYKRESNNKEIDQQLIEQMKKNMEERKKRRMQRSKGEIN